MAKALYAVVNNTNFTLQFIHSERNLNYFIEPNGVLTTDTSLPFPDCSESKYFEDHHISIILYDQDNSAYRAFAFWDNDAEDYLVYSSWNYGDSVRYEPNDIMEGNGISNGLQDEEGGAIVIMWENGLYVAKLIPVTANI